MNKTILERKNEFKHLQSLDSTTLLIGRLRLASNEKSKINWFI